MFCRKLKQRVKVLEAWRRELEIQACLHRDRFLRVRDYREDEYIRLGPDAVRERRCQLEGFDGYEFKCMQCGRKITKYPATLSDLEREYLESLRVYVPSIIRAEKEKQEQVANTAKGKKK